MPVIRRKGLAGILRDIRSEASSAADQLDRVGRAVSDVTDEAQKLSRIQAPGTFGAPTPRSTSPFSPIVGVGGSVIGGRRTSTSSAGGGGGDDGGGGSGGGGGGRVGVKDPWLTSLTTGIVRPFSWISANCRLVEQVVLDPFGFPTRSSVKTWDCGGLGVFPHPGDGILSSVSQSSTGSRQGHPGGSASTARPLYGRGISNSVLDIRNTNLIDQGPTDYSKPGSSQGSGLQSGGQGLSAPGVEQRLDRTNTLLEQVIRGDGGTGLRAGGLL